jgi:hypothetical protein
MPVPLINHYMYRFLLGKDKAGELKETKIKMKLLKEVAVFS